MLLDHDVLANEKAVLSRPKSVLPHLDGVRIPEPKRKIRTLVAEDEPVAREALLLLLKQETDLDIVGVSSNGREAIESINRLDPDLVFLDVEMPELDGFDVVGRICGRIPIVIFVTANPEFAARAFEVAAVDYLVKPCRRERLHIALQRVRAELDQMEDERIHRKLDALLADGKGQGRVPERIAVKSGGRIVLVRLSEVDWIEASDNYVNLHAGKESHLLRETMNVLEARLPADRFVRISRSAIVNVERIKELHAMFHGEYVVVLSDTTRLTLTRNYREKVRNLTLI